MKQHIVNSLKGCAMGMAEVVPGVSGGTIAFITGIYERLMRCISNVDLDLFRLVAKGKFKEAAIKLDLVFLLSLGAGMVLGILIGITLISHLLITQPLLLWAFFFGLIAASCIYVFKQIDNWNITQAIFALVGTALAYYLTIANPGGGSDSLILIFLSGFIAISAMVLPGLSGSFILLLLGMYDKILPAVKNVLKAPNANDAIIMLVFVSGCTIGILSFARLMSYCFKTRKNLTLSILFGFMLGSLNKVWPWQEVLKTRINSKNEEVLFLSKSVLPNRFHELDSNFLYGTDPKIMAAIAVMLVGFILVFVLERLGKNSNA